MKKLTYFLISAVAIVVFFIVWLIYFFPTSSLCLSPKKILSITKPHYDWLISPDEREFAYFQQYDLFQPSAGICALPDGGTGKDLVSQTKIYVISSNATSQRPKLVATISPSPSDTMSLLGWDDSGLYLISGIASEELKYFLVNINDGSVSELPVSQHETIENRFKNYGDPDPNDMRVRTFLFLDYRHGSGLILRRTRGATTTETLLVNDNVLSESDLPYDRKSF